MLPFIKHNNCAKIEGIVQLDTKLARADNILISRYQTEQSFLWFLKILSKKNLHTNSQQTELESSSYTLRFDKGQP